jgi:DNA repair protein RAD5
LFSSAITVSYSELDIIELRGCTMVDCPDPLYSGADLIVSLSVYLRASAFSFRIDVSAGDNNQHMLKEGQETQEEQLLRDRKHSLLRLFRAVGLRPLRGGRDRDLNDADTKTDAPPVVQKRKGTVRTEIVGDGEEIEVEDGEDLTENELNVIYKR